jgi:hypothetical protein
VDEDFITDVRAHWDALEKFPRASVPLAKEMFIANMKKFEESIAPMDQTR